MRIFLGLALVVTAASVLVTSASAAQAAWPGGRTVIASTVPVSGPGPLTVLAAGSRVRLSVFVGRDQAGLATAASRWWPAGPCRCRPRWRMRSPRSG